MMEQRSQDKPVGVSPNFSERQKEREYSAELTAIMMKGEAKRFDMNTMQYANLVNGFLFGARRDDNPVVEKRNPSNSGEVVNSKQPDNSGSSVAEGLDIHPAASPSRREVPKANRKKGSS